jgi:hypothetical protein
MTRTILAAVSLALAAALFVTRRQLASQRTKTVAAALTASNALAERDSTRTLARLSTDSLRVVEKRIVQQAQHDDSLDAALGRDRRALYALNTAIDSLRATAAAVVAVDPATTDRHATFEIREAPYTVAAQVDLPEPPDSARLALHVALDTIPITAHVGCDAPDANGVRTASIAAAAPAWANVRFGRVEQAPDVCMTSAPSAAEHHHLAFKPLALGFGRAFSWSGGSSWSLFIGGTIIWV